MEFSREIIYYAKFPKGIHVMRYYPFENNDFLRLMNFSSKYYHTTGESIVLPMWF